MGARIRPIQIDTSGFRQAAELTARAGEYAGQGYANLGRGIGQGLANIASSIQSGKARKSREKMQAQEMAFRQSEADKNRADRRYEFDAEQGRLAQQLQLAQAKFQFQQAQVRQEALKDMATPLVEEGSQIQQAINLGLDQDGSLTNRLQTIQAQLRKIKAGGESVASRMPQSVAGAPDMVVQVPTETMGDFSFRAGSADQYRLESNLIQQQIDKLTPNKKNPIVAARIGTLTAMRTRLELFASKAAALDTKREARNLAVQKQIDQTREAATKTRGLAAQTRVLKGEFPQATDAELDGARTALRGGASLAQIRESLSARYPKADAPGSVEEEARREATRRNIIAQETGAAAEKEARAAQTLVDKSIRDIQAWEYNKGESAGVADIPKIVSEDTLRELARHPELIRSPALKEAVDSVAPAPDGGDDIDSLLNQWQTETDPRRKADLARRVRDLQRAR